MEIEYTIQQVEQQKELAKTNYKEAYDNLIQIEKYARNHDEKELLDKTIEILIEITKETSTVISITSLL